MLKNNKSTIRLSHIGSVTRLIVVMDSTTFKQLILPHSDAMYRMAYYVTADRDDALDAVQESVASLWEHRGELSAVQDVRSYAVTTAKRHAINILRRRTFATDPMDYATMVPDPDSDTASRVEHPDMLSKVRSLMKSLSSNEQQVIRLRSQAECSISEIASITGLKEDNVRQLISRARRKLKELYNNII